MKRRLGMFLACAGLALGAGADDSIGGPSGFVGGSVVIDEAVAGGVRGVGGNVTVNAPVAGSARLAAGRVEIGPAGAIASDASIAAGNVVVKGSVQGNLQVAAGHVTLDGPVGGDASIAAGSLDLGPNARIGGKLRFRGGGLNQDAGAMVAGGIDHRTGPRHDTYRVGRHAPGWIWTLGLMVLAAIVAAALPGPSARMAAELRARPWMAPLMGFIAITCIPVAAVLVMITIIGIPLGILALLGYAALLLVGYVTAAVVAGGLLLGHFKADAVGMAIWRAGAAVAAMLALALLARIPHLGGLFVFLALVVGVGLIVAVTLRREPPAAAAA